MSPLETLIHKPNSFLVPLKMFGCTCFVHFLGPQCDKLDSKAVKCFFLGFPIQPKELQVLWSGHKEKKLSQWMSFFWESFVFLWEQMVMSKGGVEWQRIPLPWRLCLVILNLLPIFFSQIVKQVKNFLWLRHFAQKESKGWSWKWSWDRRSIRVGNVNPISDSLFFHHLLILLILIYLFFSI